jgi:hypothetical protein
LLPSSLRALKPSNSQRLLRAPATRRA